MKQSIYSVSQVNSYIKNMFTQDYLLSRIAMKGEVSNCKYHTSGHIYFTLKDATGTIACVMFAGNRKGLAFRMEEGQKVVVNGSVSVYERDGRYQLYAREITLDGNGQLYEKFEKLKKELEDMGMFSQTYKQLIPQFARTVGIVTAPTGAAIRDIMNISVRRNPFVQLILYPAQVQGEKAAESIVEGIAALEQQGVDVIIVGRGGGSIEDLWAFNEEIVARAIFECRIPIISAVGHETDTTISDYVADLRAPTPSAAAELAIFEYSLFQEKLLGLNLSLQGRMRQQLDKSRERLEKAEMRLKYASPAYQLRQKQQWLIDREEYIRLLLNQKITNNRYRLQVNIAALQGLSPTAKLNQGYAYVMNEKGMNVKSCRQVHEGDLLSVRVMDGCIDAAVRGKRIVGKETADIGGEKH